MPIVVNMYNQKVINKFSKESRVGSFVDSIAFIGEYIIIQYYNHRGRLSFREGNLMIVTH